MIVFIVLNLLLAILVQTRSELLELLSNNYALGLGLTAMTAALVAAYLKKLPSIVWHDAFASSALLVWYAYWQPQFDIEAPMFFLFPLYFALLTSAVTLALINKAPNFDLESVEYLRNLEKMTRFDIGILVAFVMISLLITRHYALYPMTMTFFIIRHTIIVCLENIDR